MAEVTLQDLLTMRTGIRARDSYIYQAEGLWEMFAADDLAEYFFSLPLDAEPGTRFDYSSLAYFMVSAIIEKTTGMDPVSYAREAGIFRSYKINGVPAISILSIPALTTCLHLAIVTAIITFSAPLLFDAPLPVSWFGYVLTFIATTFACAGIGVLIGVISSSTRSTVLWSQLIFLPSMLLGGLMLPYSMLPDAVQKVAQLLPSTQAMNAFNGLAMGKVADFSPWVSIIILFFGGVLSFGLAVYLFSWDSQNTTRRGHPLLALLAWLPYALGVVIGTFLIL